MKYRIISRYPYYNGCFPITGYVVQMNQGGLFSSWKDIKAFESKSRAQELLRTLRGY